MPDETTIQRILDEIAQRPSRDPLPLLRDQLLAMGYPPDAIEAAFARLAAQSAQVAPPQEASVPRSALPDRDAQIQRMVAYLRENRNRYSTEALRRRLLETAQDPTLVDAAIAQEQAERPVDTRAAWPLGLAVGLLNLLLLPFVLTIIVQAVSQNSYNSINIIFWLWLIIMVGELVTGLVLLSGSRNRTARVLLFGVLFSIVIPIVLGILLFGICLVIIGVASLSR